MLAAPFSLRDLQTYLVLFLVILAINSNFSEKRLMRQACIDMFVELQILSAANLRHVDSSPKYFTCKFFL